MHFSTLKHFLSPGGECLFPVQTLTNCVHYLSPPLSPPLAKCLIVKDRVRLPGWWFSMFSFLFCMGLYYCLPSSVGVCAHSQITATQMNRFCLTEQLTCDSLSLLFRLGMNTDPKNQRAGRVSMKHIRLLAGASDPHPSSLWLSAKLCEKANSLINLDIQGNGSLAFYLACIIGGVPRAI